MEYSAIDIGSNTVQMLVSSVDSTGYTCLFGGLETTRLGDSAQPGYLSPAAIAHTAATVAEFMQQINAMGVKPCRIVATSAVRDARNSKDLYLAIQKAAPTAPEVEIISGEREAQLSYLGACLATGGAISVPVLDTGGSSSELIWMQKGRLHAVSANVGAVRAMKNAWDSAAIAQRLAQVFPSDLKVDSLLGVGGVITTAAAIQQGLQEYQRENVEGVCLSRADLQELLLQLIVLPRTERCAYYPLLKQRGEIMVEGLWIWLAVLELLGAHQVVVTGGGILDGMIAEMAGISVDSMGWHKK